jgi:hypothetical protein
MQITRLANLVWLRLPAMPRGSPTARLILADGAYLLSWPALSLAAPIAALGIGLGVGWQRPDDQAVYTFSLLLLGLMVAISGLGAQLGCWATIGYGFGDLILRDYEPLFGAPTNAFDWFKELRLSRLITYGVLWGLLAFATVAASVLPSALTRGLRIPPDRAWTVRLVLLPSVLAGLAYAWTKVTPYLIRPFYTFSDVSPDPRAIQPLQQHGLRIVGVAVAASFARLALEWLAGRRRVSLQPIRGAQPAGRPLILLVGGFVFFLICAFGLPAYVASGTPNFAHSPFFWLGFVGLLGTLALCLAPPRRFRLPAPVRLSAAGLGATATALLAAALLTKGGLEGGFLAPTYTYADGGILATLAAGVVAIGALLLTLEERAASLRAKVEQRSRVLLPLVGRTARAALQTTLLLLALAGLLTTRAEEATLGAAFFALFLWRGVAAPLIPFYARLIERIPLPLRIGVVVAVSYLVARPLVKDALETGETGFRPYLVGIGVSLALGALLLPRPPPSRGRREFRA